MVLELVSGAAALHGGGDTEPVTPREELLLDPDLLGLSGKPMTPRPQLAHWALRLPAGRTGCTLSCLTCSSFLFLQTMGDVKLAASTHVSKTSLTMDHSRVGSTPLTEAPAFILPPRNLCIKEGATAKFEGRVRSEAGVGDMGASLLLQPSPQQAGLAEGLFLLWACV